MGDTGIVSRIHRKLAVSLFGEDRWTRRHGNFRDRQLRGLVPRPPYGYGMLRAADEAKYFGHKKVTVLEFGVASGSGLMNMAGLARRIRGETGIDFRIVGFDTGEGLPDVKGYKDHAELWSARDFAMRERDELLLNIGNNAEIIFGDINDTIDDFTAKLSPECPIGFISIDVDIYTATAYALRCLRGSADLYLPAISMYLDDTSFFFANDWAGELLAIREFNEASELRKIGQDRSLPGHRPKTAEPWYQRMYVCHILDHEMRNHPRREKPLDIGDHHDLMLSNFLY